MWFSLCLVAHGWFYQPGEPHFKCAKDLIRYPANQCFGGTAAVFDSVFANQEEGLHQRAGRIAQEDPVNGKVNVGFDKGVSAKT
jgi:hypothetical protein